MRIRTNRLLTICLGIIQVTLVSARAGTVSLSADGSPGAAYKLFNDFGFGTEVPDCKHAVPHMTQQFDQDLGKNVFVFSLHRDLDDDRCIHFDRQRVELRATAPALQGLQNTVTIYRWKFKIDAGFQGSGNFCHIMQIKGYGNGHGSGAPIITLTLRVNTIEVNHGGAVKSTAMAPFKGNWVEAVMKVRHADNGSVDITLTRVNDKQTLLAYSNPNLDMWDNGAGFGGFKCGMYRSLNNKNLIRDENILIADIAVTQGDVETLPVLGAGPGRAAFAIRPLQSGLSFTLPQPGACRIEVFKPSGAQVLTLGNIQGTSGENRVELENLVPRGAYFFQLYFRDARVASGAGLVAR